MHKLLLEANRNAKRKAARMNRDDLIHLLQKKKKSE
jgi:hypothetical protein